MINNYYFFCLGFVRYSVSVGGATKSNVRVTLIDKEGHPKTSSNRLSGVLKVANVKLWWPYLMHENPGYMYSMEVRQHACLFLMEFNTHVTKAMSSWVEKASICLMLPVQDWVMETTAFARSSDLLLSIYLFQFIQNYIEKLPRRL